MCALSKWRHQPVSRTMNKWREVCDARRGKGEMEARAEVIVGGSLETENAMLEAALHRAEARACRAELHASCEMEKARAAAEALEGIQAVLAERDAHERSLKGEDLRGMSHEELERLTEDLQSLQVAHAEALLKVSAEHARRRGDSRQAFQCPITGSIMKDPVFTADGHTYERAAITQWLSRSKRSPMTNAVLEHTRLVPNVALRTLIEDAQK